MKDLTGRTGKLSPLGIITAAFFLALALRTFVVDLVSVRGASMEPTAVAGTLAVVAPSTYGLPNPFRPGYILRWAEPKPGDLVILRASGWNASVALKRVFEVGPAYLRADAGILTGRYGSVELSPSARLRLAGQVFVDRGKAFVVGDNASESLDSRDYGAVPIENIRAKVIVLIGR